MTMNYWTKLSIEYANQRTYLDDLFRVYPTIPEGLRELEQKDWDAVEHAFEKQDNFALIEALLKLRLFPIKDSYVAYLRRDPAAARRNPQTVDRLCGRLYEMGLSRIYERCSEPKETNRQIGPLFRNWLKKKTLGADLCSLDSFEASSENAILDGSDQELMQFARQRLGYTLDKGLDFVGRFNGQYVIGEAKFLTDFGGHQNAQFEDALRILTAANVDAVQIAILDGVLYIPGRNKLYRAITETYPDHNILSVLVLREFLHQL